MTRLTEKRLAILRIFQRSHRHWDAESLAQTLAQEGIRMGIATVYRGLTALENDGLIESIQTPDKKRYELAGKDHHDHMICLRCGAIEEFVHATIERLQEDAARHKNFTVTEHQLILYGYCQSCSSSLSSHST